MAMLSVSKLAILPMQDILGLGAEARMNTPSTITDNWEWRVTPKKLTPELAKKIRDITEISGRLP
jgi:4-alpha-glucanotransferase